MKQESSYAVVFERAPGNWSAYVPDLPGCVSTGASREECARNLREAIDFHIGGLRNGGFPVPPPVTEVEYVRVTEGQ